MRSIHAISRLSLVALLAGPLLSPAAEPPAVRADFSYASRYVFRGVERAGSSAQATVEFSRDDFRGGAWANLPFAGGVGREVNLNAAYIWHATADLTLEASVAHSWFPGALADDTKRTFEAGVTATLAAINSVTPSLTYYHDFRLRTDTVQASLAHSLALTKLGAFLDLSLFAGWATGDDWRPDAPGPRRHDNYGYWGVEAHLPYRVGPHSTVIAGLHYSDAIGRSETNGPFGRTSRQNLWVTLGVSLDF
jgi:hypothetical protein